MRIVAWAYDDDVASSDRAGRKCAARRNICPMVAGLTEASNPENSRLLPANFPEISHQLGPFGVVERSEAAFDFDFDFDF